jgi:amidase
LGSFVRDPGKLKIALMTGYPTGPKTEPVCAKVAEDAAKLRESLGHSVETATLPITVEKMFHLLGTICTVWTRSMLEHRSAQIGRDITEDDVEPMTWEMYQLAQNISGTQYYDVIEEVHHTGRKVGAFFEKYDILLTPGWLSSQCP